MIWNNEEYKIEIGSLNIDYTGNKETRHIPYTDKSYQINKGQESTRITCTLLAKSEEDYQELLILPFKNAISNLELKNYLFRNVRTGSNNSFNPIGQIGDYWRVTAEFVALDPMAYDKETGEPVGDL